MATFMIVYLQVQLGPNNLGDLCVATPSRGWAIYYNDITGVTAVLITLKRYEEKLHTRHPFREENLSIMNYRHDELGGVLHPRGRYVVSD